MSSDVLQQLKQRLIDAGVEIYRTVSTEIQVAERHRLHIMDSGVRVRAGETGCRVAFTARSQRSDFPNGDAEQLFQRVRDSVGLLAVERGYAEESATTIEVKDPMDDSKVLDTWHEVTYAKLDAGVDDVVPEVQWALTLEKYVG